MAMGPQGVRHPESMLTTTAISNARRSGARAFPLLGSPIRLAGLEIPNRLAMAAMSSVLGTDQGEVTPELIAYYKARADGGTGLVTVEFTCVDAKLGRAETKQLVLDDDRYIAGHARARAEA